MNAHRDPKIAARETSEAGPPQIPAIRATARMGCVLLVAFLAACTSAFGASSALLGWNNLGMHCEDKDFSVFSILPPYNTIEAQLIVNGALVTDGSGYTITYEAVADPDGSINSTSFNKVNFWTYTPSLYGPLMPDVGLLGWAMPGAGNVPQAMLFENTNSPARRRRNAGQLVPRRRHPHDALRRRDAQAMSIR